MKNIKKSSIVEVVIGITLLLIIIIAIGAAISQCAISQCTPSCKSISHSRIYYYVDKDPYATLKACGNQPATSQADLSYTAGENAPAGACRLR